MFLRKIRAPGVLLLPGGLSRRLPLHGIFPHGGPRFSYLRALGFPKPAKSFLFENKTAVLENGGDRGEDKEEK